MDRKKPRPDGVRGGLFRGLVLVLPVALVAMGVWQLTRVTGQADAFEARAARLQAGIDRIGPLVARTPDAIVRFNGNPQSYTARDALGLMEADRTTLRRDVLVDEARTVAAWAAVGGGVLAFLAAVVCLGVTANGARRGRRSRDALVAAFARVVRALPPLLGSVAVGCSIGVVGAVLFEVGGGWFLDSVDTGEVKLMLLGVVFAGGCVAFAVASVRRLFQALGALAPQPMEVLGRAAGRAEAPGLWAFVDRIASVQGAARPDHVVLGLTRGFFVTSSGVQVSPDNALLSGRTLYLSAAVLPLLGEAEIASIVAHELAHFTGEDTQFSQHFLPLYASMVRSMEAVAARTRSGTKPWPWAEPVFQPAAALAGFALETFHHVVSHWSRLRELEADRAGLAATSGRAAATALLRSSMGSEIVAATLHEVYSRPSRASGDVVGEVLARAGAVGFTDAAGQLEDEQPHPTDSHPPTRTRIAAFGVAVDDALLAEASRPLAPGETAFVEGLFTDWVGFRKRLGSDLLGIAREQDRQYQAALEAAAEALPDEVEIHERGTPAVVALAVVGAVLLGLGGLVGWIAASPNSFNGPDDHLIVAGTAATLLVVGGLFVWSAMVRRRRMRLGPFLVLGREGFRCIGIAGAVPWSSVQGIGVVTGQKSVTTFGLMPDAPLPVRTGRWSVKVDRKRRRLVLTGYVPRGMKAQAYLDLLNRGLRGWRAQEALRVRAAEEAEQIPIGQ